ncbi:hypothetical protein DM02DRAFT_328026 [Periconia macrospinosa]|uniref:Uncharacterized protein n=1 Tax=Periconia macrospinosa TaxID=97972 RepID=A0A2V1EAD7_9PLEO|nr:hypothetical protein DM02DRAFT_328026 [Periconia macrospinosa]
MSQTASATGANSTPLSPSEAGANGEVEASHSGSGDNQSQKRDRSQGRAENEISGGEMEAHREDDKDDKNEHIEPEANENSENEKGWKRKKGTESFSSRRFRPSERFLSEKPVRPSKRPLRKANETLVEYNKRLWKVDIDRSTVVAWKKGDQWENIEWPQPVLQVFYHRKPDAAHSFQDDDKKSKYTAQQDDEDMYEPLGKSKNIHRITIHSEPLTDELNSILQVSSASTKLTVSPPYKVG